jgi:hypothetical protein
MRDTAVLFPTLRSPEAIVPFIENARDSNFDLGRLFVAVITEDGVDVSRACKLLKEHGIDNDVYGEKERRTWFLERNLAKFGHVIPRRSHAETSFGELLMAEDKSLEFGIFVDDDTAPLQGIDFFGTHLANLGLTGSIPEVRADGNWINPLYHSFSKHELYPRGFPYSQIRTESAVHTVNIAEDAVVLSQGLWTNVPDLDAVRILAEGATDGIPKTRLTPDDYGPTFTVPVGSFTTVCSMNLSFKRKVIPAFYQLPMDDNEWGIGRFDDIWSGLILKRISDSLGYRFVSGHPLVAHNKFPRSTFKDLRAEVPALEPNETFHEVLAEVAITGRTFAEGARSVAVAMLDGRRHPFIRFSGERMLEWIELTTTLGLGSASSR